MKHARMGDWTSFYDNGRRLEVAGREAREGASKKVTNIGGVSTKSPLSLNPSSFPNPSSNFLIRRASQVKRDLVMSLFCHA